MSLWLRWAKMDVLLCKFYKDSISWQQLIIKHSSYTLGLLQFVTEGYTKISKPFVALVMLFFSSLLIFFQCMYGLVALCYGPIQNIPNIKPFVALVTFFSPPSIFFFFLCMVLLHFVTDWYKIFPIQNNLSHSLRFFSLPFLIFFQDLVLLQFVTEGYTKISI